jgi:hypothetical protein
MNEEFSVVDDLFDDLEREVELPFLEQESNTEGSYGYQTRMRSMSTDECQSIDY